VHNELQIKRAVEDVQPTKQDKGFHE